MPPLNILRTGSGRFFRRAATTWKPTPGTSATITTSFRQFQSPSPSLAPALCARQYATTGAAAPNQRKGPAAVPDAARMKNSNTMPTTTISRPPAASQKPMQAAEKRASPAPGNMPGKNWGPPTVSPARPAAPAAKKASPATPAAAAPSPARSATASRPTKAASAPPKASAPSRPSIVKTTSSSPVATKASPSPPSPVGTRAISASKPSAAAPPAPVTPAPAAAPPSPSGARPAQPKQSGAAAAAAATAATTGSTRGRARPKALASGAQEVKEDKKESIDPGSPKFKSAAWRWGAVLASIPVLLVTSYFLYDRLVLGRKPPNLDDFRPPPQAHYRRDQETRSWFRRE